MNKVAARGLLRSKALLMACAATLALMALFAMTPQQAYADNGGKLEKKVVVTFVKRGYQPTQLISEKSKITGLANSNGKVVTAELDCDSKTVYVNVKKRGTAKITYQVGGKEKSVTYNVIGYSSPVKKFKVGSDDYTTQFKKRRAASVAGGALLSGKVTVRAAKGWRLKELAASGKAIRNGTVVTDCGQVTATLVNKKNGCEETIDVANGWG